MTTRKEERNLARSYEFFRDQCAALNRRNQHFAVNPADEKEMDYYRERVMEDDLWQGGQAPRVIPFTRIPKGEVYVLKASEVMTMHKAMNSNQGLGRFTKLYVPSYAKKRMDD